MRRLLPLACLAVAACSANQASAPTPVPAPSRTGQSGVLIGLTRGEVARHFGLPAFTVQEGPGLKIQYRGKACVLDFYLYPPETGSGEAHVTHVDARDHDGRDTGQASCVSGIMAH